MRKESKSIFSVENGMCKGFVVVVVRKNIRMVGVERMIGMLNSG